MFKLLNMEKYKTEKVAIVTYVAVRHRVSCCFYPALLLHNKDNDEQTKGKCTLNMIYSTNLL